MTLLTLAQYWLGIGSVMLTLGTISRIQVLVWSMLKPLRSGENSCCQHNISGIPMLVCAARLASIEFHLLGLPHVKGRSFNKPVVLIELIVDEFGLHGTGIQDPRLSTSNTLAFTVPVNVVATATQPTRGALDVLIFVVAVSILEPPRRRTVSLFLSDAVCALTSS